MHCAKSHTSQAGLSTFYKVIVFASIILVSATLPGADSESFGPPGLGAGAPAFQSYDYKEAAPPCKVTEFDSSTKDCKYIQAPFFYANKIYAVSKMLYENKTLITAGALDSSGRYVYEKEFLVNIESSERYSSCIYKGTAYVFHARVIEGSKFRIFYHKSGMPEKDWQPAGTEGYDSGLVGDAQIFDNFIHVGMKALVFNEMIYVLYSKEKTVWFSSFDGETWTHRGKLEQWSLNAQLSACVTTRRGEPVICLVTTAEQSPGYGRLLVWIIERDHKVPYTDFVAHLHSSGVEVRNCFSVEPGTLGGESQTNQIQIFGHNDSWWYWWVRRISMSPESGFAQQTWSDVPIESPSRRWAIIPCDTISVPVATGANPFDFRQHIVVFTMYGIHTYWQACRVASYESNFYQYQKGQDTEANTGSSDTLEKGCWTLLGVIQGVPPFTRNGLANNDAISNVVYAQSKVIKNCFEIKYEAGVYGGVELGQKDIFKLGGSAEYLFSTTNEFETTLTNDFKYTFSSINNNREGTRGWLIYAKPVLHTRKYASFAHDQKTKLGEFRVLSVSKVDVGQEDFLLEAPPEGMGAKPRSTDISAWKQGLPEHQDFTLVTGNTMDVSPSSKGDASISKDTKKIESAMHSVNMMIYGELTIKKLFTFSGGGSFKVAVKSSVSTTFHEGVSCSLSLPYPSAEFPDPVKTISFTPAWYYCNSENPVKKIPNPGWFPKNALDQNIVPWCVTWSVTNIVKGRDILTDRADFIGDGSPDILRMNESSLSLLMQNAATKKWRNIIFSLDPEKYRILAPGHFNAVSKGYEILCLDKITNLPVLWILHEDGSGVFEEWGNTAIGEGEEVLAYDDFDGDGDWDILLKLAEDGSFWLLKKDGTKTCIYPSEGKEEAKSEGGNYNFEYIGKGDFDGDGKMDFLVDGNDIAPWFAVSVEDGLEARLNPVIYPGIQELDVAGIGDMDGDNCSDLLLLDSKRRVSALFLIDCSAVRLGRISGFSKIADGMHVVQIADLDGNGLADVVLQNNAWPAAGTEQTSVYYLHTSVRSGGKPVSLKAKRKNVKWRAIAACRLLAFRKKWSAELPERLKRQTSERRYSGNNGDKSPYLSVDK